MDLNTYQTPLLAAQGTKITLGPVLLFVNPNGYLCIQTEKESDQLYQNTIQLLYFAANSPKIYSGKESTPLSAYFKKTDTSHTIDIQKIEPPLLKALGSVLSLSADPTRKNEVIGLLQAIKCLNAAHDAEAPLENWKGYLLLSSGYEALFGLNPAFPAADLRQNLRPILNIKFSHPVELLWKWVDQFYLAKSAVLKGETPNELLFLDNPQVKTPLLLIAEKLLIYSIYNALFTKHLENTQEPISEAISPERVLVYFWTQATLDRKIPLLEGQQEDLAMINNIKETYHHLQNSTLAQEVFIKA